MDSSLIDPPHPPSDCSCSKHLVPQTRRRDLTTTMAASEDLINFDVIEGQKENIQSLPGGRSAKKLAELYSPSPLHKLSTPTPSDTKNINDCIRAEYEAEVANLAESD